MPVAVVAARHRRRLLCPMGGLNHGGVYLSTHAAMLGRQITFALVSTKFQLRFKSTLPNIILGSLDVAEEDLVNHMGGQRQRMITEVRFKCFVCPLLD